MFSPDYPIGRPILFYVRENGPSKANAANARWNKTSDSAEIPGTHPITSNSKADISIVTNLASPSAVIENQGDGKLESDIEVKEDS